MLYLLLDIDITYSLYCGKKLMYKTFSCILRLVKMDFVLFAILVWWFLVIFSDINPLR